ncbi:MAG: ATP synthase F1 subunit delta [Bdellovibrionota bacterium]
MNKYSGALARRYGTALFEILVGSSKNQDEFAKHVADIRLIWSFCSKKTIRYFLIASLTDEERVQTLELFLKNIFLENQLSPEISSFLKLLLQNKRFREVKPIFYFFLSRSDEYLGIARATIISARPIQAFHVNDFEVSLKQVLNKKIVLKTELDESLKSGFIVKLGHTNIDASFKARLNGLKDLFI